MDVAPLNGCGGWRGAEARSVVLGKHHRHHRLSGIAGADRHDGEVLAGRPVAVAEVLADVAHQHAHGHAVAVGGAERVVARHPEDVPQAPALVLETAVALGKRDQAIPDGARDGDGNLETGFARGFGDVDEDAVLDRLGAGIGEDHGIECGGVAGLGHGRVPVRGRYGGDRSGRGAGETGDGPRRGYAGTGLRGVGVAGPPAPAIRAEFPAPTGELLPGELRATGAARQSRPRAWKLTEPVGVTTT